MNHNQMPQSQYTLENFLPLIAIIVCIILITLCLQLIYGFNLQRALTDFMGSFFIIFAAFKIFNIVPFAHAYVEYDIIAKHFYWYGFLYPFLEAGLGILYLSRSHLFFANIATILLMTVSSVGVAIELAHNRTIMCACLGAVFKIPMTYVTLAEDLSMGLMALFMLFF